jgi:hypothetical protein
MRKLLLASVLCFLLAGSFCSTSAASVLWYNGDFNGGDGLSNERNTLISDGRVYDDFYVTGSGFDINSVFSNNLTNDTISQAYWEIRSGVSSGNGGTLLYSGTDAASQTTTGRSDFGYTEYMIEVSGLDISLPMGHYWLTVAPIDSGAGRSFISTTSGANFVGSGDANNSFFDSVFFSVSFTPASNYVGSPADFSMGLTGSVASVPEPTSLILLGTGIGAIGLGAWRKRK